MESYVFTVSDSEGNKNVYVINEEQKRLYDKLKQDGWLEDDSWEWGECEPYEKFVIVDIA